MSFRLSGEDYKKINNGKQIVRQTNNLSPLIQRYADLTFPVKRGFNVGGVALSLNGSILFVGNHDVADFSTLPEGLRQDFEAQIVLAVQNEMKMVVQDPDYREFRLKFLRNVLDPQSVLD